MTIEKGKPWGTPSVVPSTRRVVSTDRELAQCTTEDECSLSGGDIWRSLGAPEIPAIGANATKVYIDAVQIHIDNTHHLFASSSVEVGSFLGRGRYLCLANSSFVGKKNIAPRAHPNDGSLDYLEIDAEISWRQRWLASRRSLTGTHIPHPKISSRRVREIEIQKQHSSEKMRIDGVVYKEWTSIQIRIWPDHWQVLL